LPHRDVAVAADLALGAAAGRRSHSPFNRIAHLAEAQKRRLQKKEVAN
jgi:hypothetical protein